MQQVQQLQQRWSQLMQRIGYSANHTTFEQLIAAYSQPHRHYHNLTHLSGVLQGLDQASQLAEQPLELELALWFHDAVYAAFSRRNELNSATWAQQFLQQNQATPTQQQRVGQLILATEHSESNHHTVLGDQQLINDIDLAILGQSETDYNHYSHGVRQEYRKVPNFIYRRKRRQLLQQFLQRPRIYQFDQFYRALEAPARANIHRELTELC